jgi:hypothetical protein
MIGRHNAQMKMFLGILVLVTSIATSIDAAQSAEKKYTKQEIKDLLNHVWQASELDFSNFRDYVFCEREVREYKLLGGTWEGLRLRGMRPHENFFGEYVWVIRNDHFVRSPTHINGVEVSAQQQKDYEEQWIKDEQKRAKARSALEYFFLSDGAVGNPGSFKQMKEGSYKFKAEATIGKLKVIMVQADYSNPLSVGYAFFISPEENRFVQFDAILKGFGKYSMLMGQPIDNAWLPLKCSGTFEYNFPAQLSWVERGIDQRPRVIHGYRPACHFASRHTREFYSFKKSDVKAKFWFEDVDAEIGHETDKPKSLH